MSRSTLKWFVLLFFTVSFWTIPLAAQHRAGQAPRGNPGMMRPPMPPPQRPMPRPPQMPPQQKQMPRPPQQKQMPKQQQIPKQQKPSQRVETSKKFQGQPPAKKAAQVAGASDGGTAKNKNGDSTGNSKTDAKKKDAGKSKTAQKKTEKRPLLAEKKPQPKRQGVLPHDQASAALLHEARTQLESADHDYAGHRVRAIEHIHSALGHLGSPSAGGGGGGGQGQGNMPQSASDAALRAALVKLQTAQGHLSSKTATAEHHGNARGAVSEAIRELNTALAIR